MITPAPTITVRYEGLTRGGRSLGGLAQIHASQLSFFVQRRYRQGWKYLVVTRPDDTQNPIGMIDTVDGRRTWWAQR